MLLALMRTICWPVFWSQPISMSSVIWRFPRMGNYMCVYIYICWNLWFGDPHFKKPPWILFICPRILRLELGPSSKLEAPQDPKLNYRATLQQRQGILPQAGSSTGRNRHGEVRRIQPLGAKGRGCLLGKTWATSMEIQPMDICECPTS